MFSSNSRRASIVSEGKDVETVVFVRVLNPAHAIAAIIETRVQMRAAETSRAERRCMAPKFKLPLRCSATACLPDDSLDNRHAALQVPSVHHQWWQQTKGVITSRQSEQSFLPPSLHDVVSRLDNIDTPHIPHASDCANLAGAGCDRCQLFSQPCSVASHVFQQGGIGQALKDVTGYGRDEWSATKRGSMVPGLHGGPDIFIYKDRSHRQTARQRFGQRQNVGRHTE